MAKIERRSSLAKAPALDVVAALTTPTQAVEGTTPQLQDEVAAPNLDDPTVASTVSAENRRASVEIASPTGGASVRRGPGRPRSRRRMEPFSSKIDIDLRDRVDQYIEEHGTTFVDLIDEALRARIGE